MKAIELREPFGIDSLHLIDKPAPRPGAGEVLLRMKAWSLNYRDLLVAKGMYNPKLKLPITPLSDGVGEVVEVGPGVSRVKVGQRVCSCFFQRWPSGTLDEAAAKSALGGGGIGMAAEYVALSELGVVEAPEHLTDEEAATLPCAALTAWNALVDKGRVKAGDTVLTQGTGGVSLFALQFAHMHGARVLITSSSDDKLARARQLGAEIGVNYRTTPAWEEEARTWSGGTGVDHVVEVGGAGTLAQSFKAVRLAGGIYLIGVLAGNQAQVNPVPVLMKQIQLQGIFVGNREMFEAMNRAISARRMRPVVDRVYPLAEIRDALKSMENAQHFGKICLRV